MLEGVVCVWGANGYEGEGHVNNLYNTTFWALIQKGGMSATEADEELKVCLFRVLKLTWWLWTGTCFNGGLGGDRDRMQLIKTRFCFRGLGLIIIKSLRSTKRAVLSFGM